VRKHFWTVRLRERQQTRLASRDRALYGLTLLVAIWKRAISLYSLEQFPRTGSGAERVFPILNTASDTDIQNLLVTIIDRGVVEPHLNTTLRKMGNGLKCSLRFFRMVGFYVPLAYMSRLASAETDLTMSWASSLISG